MRNVLLKLSFDGTAYHGWQVQHNAVTIQQVLQDALETILKERPPVTGCSRTDAGVHANEFCCNFRTGRRIPCADLLRALNACLPRDIRVFSCCEVPEDFHARYSALGKEYLYRIDNGAVRNPFEERYALFYPYPLLLPPMEQAARFFRGKHDFAAFCASGSSVQTTERTVSLFEIIRQRETVVFRVRADGFLYHMVRIMAGTLLYVSQKKIRPEDIPELLRARDRSLAGPTVSACGLYLNRVFYPSAFGNGTVCI